jgi:lysophospholipase L1-like esterase
LACYNRGIGGDVTRGVFDRLDVSVFDLAPSKIVLMIGTNDIDFGVPNEEILSNYRLILDKIKETQPLVELYFVSVIPQNKQLEQSSGLNVTKNNETIKFINNEIQKLCAEYGHKYIDLHSALLDRDGYLKADVSDDGLHLNAEGFKIWTSLLKPHLQE